jgi:hypothetical protein
VTNFWKEEEARWTAERRTFYEIDQGREYQERKLGKKKNSRVECLKPSAAPDSQLSYYRRIGERERLRDY